MYELIDRCEKDLPVTEQEKVLCRLSYLMELMIGADDKLRLKFKELAGRAEFYSELDSAASEEICSFAAELGIPSGRVLFWMWRAWLLQFTLMNSDTGPVKATHSPGTDLTGDVRTSLEDQALDDGLSEEFRRAREHVEIFAKLLHESGEQLQAQAADYTLVLAMLQGSPIARIEALRRLHLRHVNETAGLRDKLLEFYGFTKHQKPNKRMDANSARDVEIFFHWKRPTFAEMAAKNFNSIAAAQKAASRFNKKLMEYERILEQLENGGLLAPQFYARRIW